jgi:hypothetical protein
VGEISDLVIGGLDIFGAISKIIDLASLAKTIDDADIFSLLGTLGDEAGLAEAAAGVEDVLDTATLVTRGKFGEAFSKVTDNLVQCAESNIEGLVMDGLDLGTSVSMSKRRFGFELFQPRARAGPCAFNVGVIILASYRILRDLI